MLNETSALQQATLLERIDELLRAKSALAWKIHNTLAFMAEALNEDGTDELPVKCTIVDLRDDVDQLASDLMDLVGDARRALQPGPAGDQK